MLIRMLVGLTGNQYVLEPGDERDFPDAEALRLVAADFAVPVVSRSLELAIEETVVETRPAYDAPRRRGRPRKAA